MRVIPILVSTVIAVALSGCSTADTHQESQPEASQTALFKSEEEALAAAEQAYSNYLFLNDQITSDGGSNPERISAYVSEGHFLELEEGYSALAELNAHSGGSTTFDHVSVQKIEGETVSVYLCVDVSKNPILSAEGQDMTSESRISRVPLIVLFRIGETVIIEKSEVWTGANFC